MDSPGNLIIIWGAKRPGLTCGTRNQQGVCTAAAGALCCSPPPFESLAFLTDKFTHKMARLCQGL